MTLLAFGLLIWALVTKSEKVMIGIFIFVMVVLVWAWLL